MKFLIEFKLPGDEAVFKAEEVEEDEEFYVDDSSVGDSDSDSDDVEPPKKKQKTHAEAPRTAQYAPPSSIFSNADLTVMNPYSKILATVKSNYELLATNKSAASNTNKKVVQPIQQQEQEDVEDDVENNEEEIDEVGDGSEEIELPEGTKLLTIKQVNPYVSNIGVKGRVIYKSEMFKWGVDKKHTKEGCFFYFEIIDENVSFLFTTNSSFK